MSGLRDPDVRYNVLLVEKSKGMGAGMTAMENPPAAAGEWKVRRVGTATFAISKPKRKAKKIRQSRLKNRRRAR